MLLVLMEVLLHQKKGLISILVKQTQNLAWVYIVMLILVILLTGKKSLNLKPTIKRLTFQLNLSGSISNGFSATESREVSLNRNVYEFSVD